MKDIKGIFVGGTGTGVGKTLLSILLMTYLQARKVKVAPFKPAETGCKPAPLDTLALMAAVDDIFSLEEVCPFRLALPAAPEAAADREGRQISFKTIKKSFDALAGRVDMVIVEGAGAVSTPYAKGLTGIEIARKLDIPVLLVTSEKLGTVGQTIAAVKALKYSRTRILGVALSITSGTVPKPHHNTNAQLIRAHLRNVPFLGALPHLPIRGDSLEKLPYAVLPEWAGDNLVVFEKYIGPSLEKVLSL